MLQFLSIKSWIEQAALTHFLFINGSLVVSWGLLAIIVNFITPSRFILIRQKRLMMMMMNIFRLRNSFFKNNLYNLSSNGSIKFIKF